MSAGKRKAPDTQRLEREDYGARARIIAATPSARTFTQSQEEPQQEPQGQPVLTNTGQRIDVPIITVPMTSSASSSDMVIPFENREATNVGTDFAGNTVRFPNPPNPISTALFGGRARDAAPYEGQARVGMSRRRKRYAGFSRRSFKFLRWLYHIRKKRRFTPAQQANAYARRAVFYRAWKTAKEQGRKYLTGADVKAAQGTVAGYATKPGNYF